MRSLHITCYGLRMSLYTIVLEMKKLLGAVDGWLVKATAHAAAKKYEPAVLLQSRLAPDMFSLLRQLHSACDQAKYAAGRAAGKDVPPHTDLEQTFEEVRKRIADVIGYLDGFSARDFEGTDERTIALPRWEGKSM